MSGAVEGARGRGQTEVHGPRGVADPPSISCLACAPPLKGRPHGTSFPLFSSTSASHTLFVPSPLAEGGGG